MRILYVDLEFDYGDASRGPNIIGRDGFQKAMHSLGHEVIPFYYDHDLQGSSALQTRLIDKAKEHKPELIVFCLFRDQFKVETLRELGKIAPTLNWFGDDTWRFDSFSSVFAPAFDFVVTTDKFSLPRYHKLGVKNVIVSQWAAIDTHARSSFEGRYHHDVSFVGQHHPYRAWIVNELKKRGLRVEGFGRGWASGPLNSERMNHLFRHSKINLNIGNSTSLDIGYLVSHPKAALLALRSRKNRSQIKARNFEIPFFGGFQLTDYVPGIEDYFEIGREIACYRDIDDAELQIRYFLDREDERERIRVAGANRAANDGYSERWRKVLSTVAETTGPRRRPEASP